jgi:ATP-dependent Clp protease ATP-binding subunit ClpB
MENVGVEHLLHALAQEIRGPAGEILSAFGIGPGRLPAARRRARASGQAGRRHRLDEATAGSGASTGRRDEYVRDLVAEAKDGRFDPVIGRDVEVRACSRSSSAASRTTRSWSASRASARRPSSARSRAHRRGDVPSNLAGARARARHGALVAGAKLRGEIESA